MAKHNLEQDKKRRRTCGTMDEHRHLAYLYPEYRRRRRQIELDEVVEFCSKRGHVEDHVFVRHSELDPGVAADRAFSVERGNPDEREVQLVQRRGPETAPGARVHPDP